MRIVVEQYHCMRNFCRLVTAWWRDWIRQENFYQLDLKRKVRFQILHLNSLLIQDLQAVSFKVC